MKTLPKSTKSKAHSRPNFSSTCRSFTSEFPRRLTKSILLVSLIGFASVALLPRPSLCAADSGSTALLGELGLEVGYERVETQGLGSSPSSSSASTRRLLRASVAQYASLSFLDANSFYAGLSLRTDRGEWFSNAIDQLDLGANVGWLHDQWFLFFGWIFLSEEKTTSNSIETQNKSGSGFTAGVRFYQWWNTEHGKFGVAPSLTYDSIRYTKSQVGTLPESSVGALRESFRPGLSFAFQF